MSFWNSLWLNFRAREFACEFNKGSGRWATIALLQLFLYFWSRDFVQDEKMMLVLLLWWWNRFLIFPLNVTTWHHPKIIEAKKISNLPPQLRQSERSKRFPFTLFIYISYSMCSLSLSYFFFTAVRIAYYCIINLPLDGSGEFVVFLTARWRVEMRKNKTTTFLRNGKWMCQNSYPCMSGKIPLVVWLPFKAQGLLPQTICGYMKETTRYQNNEVKFNRLNRIEGARSFMWPHRNQIFVFFNQIKHLNWHANCRHEMFKQVEEILIIDLVLAVLPILMKLILILSGRMA